MSEQLARSHQVQDAAVQDDLDGAAAHHSQMLDRLRRLGEDPRSGQMELDVRRRGDALDGCIVERVERRVYAQEAGDLEQRLRTIVQIRELRPLAVPAACNPRLRGAPRARPPTCAFGP